MTKLPLFVTGDSMTGFQLAGLSEAVDCRT